MESERSPDYSQYQVWNWNRNHWVQDPAELFSNLCRREYYYGMSIIIAHQQPRGKLTFPSSMMVLFQHLHTIQRVYAHKFRGQIHRHGRPVLNLSIQGIGGVKGFQSLNWNYIYRNSRSVYLQATPEQQAILANLTTLPMLRSTATGVNLRDSILKPNLDDGLPAQFVYEAADCSLFWTAPMVINVRAVWIAAADAAWGGGCVAGSFPKRSMKSTKMANTASCRNSPTKQIERGAQLTRTLPGKQGTVRKDLCKFVMKLVALSNLLVFGMRSCMIVIHVWQDPGWFVQW